jgi:hypothetical protein
MVVPRRDQSARLADAPLADIFRFRTAGARHFAARYTM